MATLVKTNGRWKAVIRKVGWPTKAKSFSTKREAEEWARQVEVEMTQGVFVDRAIASKTTLFEALDKYLRSVTPTKKASTQRAEIGRIQLLKVEFGSCALTSLTPLLLAKYRDKQLENGLSPDTVRLKLAVLSSLFNVARREWGLGIPRNPVADISKPRSTARDRRLTAIDLNRLFAQVRSHSNPMLSWIVELLFETAMRKSELLNLELGDIDWDRRIVRLSDTKNGSPRSVPLSVRATELLRLACQNSMRPKSCQLIFFGEPGADEKRRPYVINKLFLKACQAANISNFRLHDLRHEATSRLVERGLSDQQVSAITGHKSMQMLRRYTHLRAEDLVTLLG